MVSSIIGPPLQINELDQEQEQTEANEQRRQAKIRELTAQLETLQAELDELDPGEEHDVQPQIEENNRQTRKLTQEMTQIQQRDEQTAQEMRVIKQEVQREWPLLLKLKGRGIQSFLPKE
jgi:hypothetical protein